MNIEKNIPITRATSKKKGKSKYQFQDMAIGDSFIIEDNKRYSVSTIARRFAINQKPEWQFTVTRYQDERLRCMRVK